MDWCAPPTTAARPEPEVPAAQQLDEWTGELSSHILNSALWRMGRCGAIDCVGPQPGTPPSESDSHYAGACLGRHQEVLDLRAGLQRGADRICGEPAITGLKRLIPLHAGTDKYITGQSLSLQSRNQRRSTRPNLDWRLACRRLRSGKPPRSGHAVYRRGCAARRWPLMTETAISGMPALASMSQADRVWLLFVLVPVFDLHVRLGSGGRQARVPGVPGSAPAPTVPGCSSFRVAGIVGAGQVGAGSAQSRRQQVMKAVFQGQSGLILRIFLRAWRTRRAGRCQSRQDGACRVLRPSGRPGRGVRGGGPRR